MFDREQKKVTRRGRTWLYGISLAVFPVLIAYGIVTEEVAILWASLIGAILVPGAAIHEQTKHEDDTQESYYIGVDEGYQVAVDENRRGVEIAQRGDVERAKREGNNE